MNELELSKLVDLQNKLEKTVKEVTAVSEPTFNFLITLGLLFCTLVILANFATGNAVIVFEVIVSKRAFIIPMTFALGAILLKTYGYQQIQRIMIYAAFCHLIACLYSQWLLASEFGSLNTAWFIPLASSTAILLSQQTNVYILSDPKKSLQNKPPFVKALLALFSATLVDSASILLFIPYHSASLPPSMALFLYTFLISILFGCLSITIGFKITRYLKSKNKTSETTHHDPVFSWKVIVAKEAKIEKHITHVGFLTERD